MTDSRCPFSVSSSYEAQAVPGPDVLLVYSHSSTRSAEWAPIRYSVPQLAVCSDSYSSRSSSIFSSPVSPPQYRPEAHSPCRPSSAISTPSPSDRQSCVARDCWLFPETAESGRTLDFGAKNYARVLVFLVEVWRRKTQETRRDVCAANAYAWAAAVESLQSGPSFAALERLCVE